jgi:hypothetical protein
VTDQMNEQPERMYLLNHKKCEIGYFITSFLAVCGHSFASPPCILNAVLRCSDSFCFRYGYANSLIKDYVSCGSVQVSIL